MTRNRDVADTQDNLGGAVSPLVAGKNKLINGNLDIWARGTSFTTINAGVYNADRWQTGAVFGTNLLTQQTAGVPVGSTYCLRFQGTMAGTLLPTQQIIESINVKPVQGKIVTFSVKLRRNASFDQNIIIYVSKSATTDATYGSTWTVISQATITNANLPTGTTSSDWVTGTVSALIPSDGTANTIKVVIDHSGVVANNGYYEFSQAMLEPGSVATSFTTASGGSIGGELALCQRYYEQSYPDGTTAGTASVLTNVEWLFSSGNIGNTQTIKNINFQVTKRGNPTVTVYGYQGGSGKVSNANGIDLAANSGIASGIGTKRCYIYNNSGADIAPAFNGFIFHWVASSEL
jgi:hypothetical protein